MKLSQIQNQIKYVTNAAGEKTEVLIPVEIWETLIELLQPIESGLDPIDSNEPKAQILADLQESIRQGRTGQTYPVSALWDDMDS
ncbi:hypothetical protein Cri9333_4939 (plasmid) [Crinalium epipsammum PCC 9333]|uniref:Uncharacterized protein n=1 Tax=Crinalium epipsammum PCC 9333 TaxID=1173022 RepID=K9W893_9CYAN|nr:hypothetical protein [Crinalium epipsammum]AFZ15695.1 hypothetical protein Cri9333_4939 [Crinalium epipsammum PCC 9333]